MIDFYITLHLWVVHVYIAVTDYNTETIIGDLLGLGCDTAQAFDVYNSLYKKQKDIGFTYSSYFLKKSVVLIGLQSSKDELINTITHESRHLQQHIANYYNLDENGETVCYLIGYIVQIIYNKCIKFQLL